VWKRWEDAGSLSAGYNLEVIGIIRQKNVEMVTSPQALVFKPHVHLVLTASGLNKAGEWVDFDGIPGGKLAVTWKKRLCDRLSQRHPQNHPMQTVLRRVHRQRRYIWMKRWLETHRRRKAAAEKLRRALATRPLKYEQLGFAFL